MKRFTIDFVLGFVFFFVLMSTSAHAWQFEAGAGATHYSDHGDGTWYQAGMPHKLSVNTPALMLGVTGDVWRDAAYGVAWHLDYVFLGSASSTCICTEYDEDYNLKTKQGRAGAPLATFSGSGNVQGIAATLEPYWHYGRYRIGVEGGIFASRPQWDESVHADNRPDAFPHTSSSLRFGPVVGVSVGYGNVSVSLRHYATSTRFSDTQYPSLLTGATVVMATYRW